MLRVFFLGSFIFYIIVLILTPPSVILTHRDSLCYHLLWLNQQSFPKHQILATYAFLHAEHSNH